MRSLIKIFWILFLPALFLARQPKNKLDSLHVAFYNTANDTLQMDVVNSIGIYYGEANLDSSFWYREKASSFARRLNLKIDEAGMLIGCGYRSQLTGNYPKSLQLILAALTILEDLANENNPFHLTDGQTPVVRPLIQTYQYREEFSTM